MSDVTHKPAPSAIPGMTLPGDGVERRLAHLEHPEHDELLTLNLGPHHPATHGVLRLITTLEGEVVRDIKPVIGYVHTGIEKNCEDKAYWKVIPLVERMDYLSYYFNAMAYCGAVETLLDIEVPPRAQYLRVAHMELNRIASHLLWLATGGLDLGAMSVFWYGWRDRDLILDLFEMSSGQRMHPRYFQVGGVAEDIPAGWVKKAQGVHRAVPEAHRPVRAADRPEPDRARAPARRRRRRRRHAARPTASPARCCAPPATRGTCARPQPYSSYEDFDFKIPVGTVGDNYDRYRVRMAEMRESVQDHRPGARRAARGRLHHLRPQVRAAAAARAGDVDGGADPPLQARDRGLPRPAGRGVLPDRVPARRARLLRALRRLLQARPRAHARPLVREPAGASSRWCRTSTSPT